MIHRMTRVLFPVVVFIFFYAVAFAQDDNPVRIGAADLVDDCGVLTLDGIVTGSIASVRVQLASTENPLVLLVDEVLPVTGAAFASDSLALYQPIETGNASLLLMVTGWNGSAYSTPLQAGGLRSLYCSHGAPYIANPPGIRFMRSTRETWQNTARYLAENGGIDSEACQTFLAQVDTTFPDTLMEGLDEVSTFPVTLRLAENGYLYQLDWQGRRIPVIDDGGVFSGEFSTPWGEDSDLYYVFDLVFTSLTTYTGFLSIEHPEGCWWIFEWTGVKSR